MSETTRIYNALMKYLETDSEPTTASAFRAGVKWKTLDAPSRFELDETDLRIIAASISEWIQDHGRRHGHNVPVRFEPWFERHGADTILTVSERHPPAPEATSSAEQKLAEAGVFKGYEGLRAFVEDQAFWDEQPYGTRLPLSDGNYLHLDVAKAALRILDGSVPAQPEAKIPSQDQGELPPVPYDEHERLMAEVIAERDHWAELATKLANQVGDHFGFEVGEHSNLNCPVVTALEEQWSTPEGATDCDRDPIAVLSAAPTQQEVNAKDVFQWAKGIFEIAPELSGEVTEYDARLANAVLNEHQRCFGPVDCPPGANSHPVRGDESRLIAAVSLLSGLCGWYEALEQSPDVDQALLQGASVTYSKARRFVMDVLESNDA